MKVFLIKKKGIGILQHCIAILLFLIIAGILVNSHIAVDSFHGRVVYSVNLFETENVFEETDLFNDLFSNSVSDVLNLVVIKSELETDGAFDSTKEIDINEYATAKCDGKAGNVSAIYELDDLIKWGRSGVEYIDRTMSMSDFIGYYGNVYDVSDFDLDEYGQLYFKGFNSSDTLTDAENAETLKLDAAYDEHQSMVSYIYDSYSDSQLEDLIFAYIIKEIPEDVTVSRQEDGTIVVHVSLLNCKYLDKEENRTITQLVDNWVDYFRLQNNLSLTIERLYSNYEQYFTYNELYDISNTNFRYAIVLGNEEDSTVYSNVKELIGLKLEDISEYFDEYRKIMVYFPDLLEFYSNTRVQEDFVFGQMSNPKYRYPDSTYIWMGVDTTFSVANDPFNEAYTSFQKLVPHMNLVIGITMLLMIMWITISVIRAVYAGLQYDENDQLVFRTKKIDSMWTELLFLLGLAYIFAVRKLFVGLVAFVESSLTQRYERWSETFFDIYKYGVFTVSGLCCSLFLCMILYSFARRIKVNSLWSNSFLHLFIRKIKSTVDFMVEHGNTAIVTLLSYNLFLLINLIGIYIMFSNIFNSYVMFIIITVLLVFDVLVGVGLFRRSAEKMDIVEGINRIRNGEVDYILDTSELHGNNKTMADAVNNIGEGIRKAVKTSMKDEQLKSDLITNVSHDIKTPLTSIINYVDLLKRLKIQDEPARGYIEILDNKAHRLKQLTDDLVEASKISSGNITLNLEVINMTELLNQGIGEFQDKFEEKKLSVVFNNNQSVMNVYADSRRMWRVLENLFNNIYKYALEGTRVYIDSENEGGIINVSVKNISKTQMNIKAEELTERFIRGDLSRSTEGSGLGLSIAKNLVEAQGGTFELDLDGDLFKAIITFPEYTENHE